MAAWRGRFAGCWPVSNRSSGLTLPALLALCAWNCPAADLTIVVENVRSAEGVVGMLLFGSTLGWPESVAAARHAKAVPARRGEVSVVFDGIPAGEYALVVLHDQNENRKLDRSWIGKPKEGWGMSNNPKARFSAPPFHAARFQLAGSMQLRVHLNY